MCHARPARAVFWPDFSVTYWIAFQSLVGSSCFCKIAMTEPRPSCFMRLCFSLYIWQFILRRPCIHFLVTFGAKQWKVICGPFAAAGKQRIGSVSALDHLNRHTDRLKVALRDFEAASDSKVLVRGDDFQSYGDFLQLLQQIKVFLSHCFEVSIQLASLRSLFLQEAASKYKAGKYVCWLTFAGNCMSHAPCLRQFMLLLLSHADLVEATFRSMTWLPSIVKVMHVILKHQLMPIALQILIVPAEVAEVDDLDFEAILSGCLLVKVDPASFQAYPDIFEAEERILGSPSDWHGLQDTLTSALQVCICLLITHW